MKQNKGKSLKINALLNTIQTIISMLFPLITFPYASRVLGVDNIGKYNFGNSIVSYFVLLAGLGISTYGVREGAKYRDNKKKFEEFVQNIFSINLYSTLLAYFLLILCLFYIPQLVEYRILILILSSQILFITIGRNWIYTVYEDYFFITIRTIIFYLISCILLFTVVRDESDLYMYCVVNVVGVIGINILNIIYSRKYSRFIFKIKPDIRHLKSILLIFSTAVSVVIYTSSDVTLLGLMCSDKNVGLYSASVKIYNIVKQMLAAVLTVTIPRIAYYIGKSEVVKFRKLFFNISNVLVIIVCPAAIGLVCLSEDVIYILAGENYLSASVSLKILSIAIIFNLFAYMYGYCILIPYNRESKFVKATIISAVCNICLNIIFIPIFQQNAAALTTLIAEIVAATMCYHYSRDIISKSLDKKNILVTLIGCIYICRVCLGIYKFVLVERFIRLIISVLISAIGYFLIQIVLRNMVFITYSDKIFMKVKRLIRINME